MICDKDKNEILRLRQEKGLTYTAIHKKTNFSITAIWDICKNVKRREKRRAFHKKKRVDSLRCISNDDKQEILQLRQEGILLKDMPTEMVYKNVLNKLIEKNEINCALIMRLAGEAGLCRMEIAEAEVDSLNFRNRRGLDLQVAKRVRGRYAKESHMRTREIPLHTGLYEFILENIDVDRQKYIVSRIRGDFNKPFSHRHVFHFFENNNLPFTIHHLRHYFKSMVWSWMIQNKQPDVGVLKEIMGHAKTVHELYGKYTWNYKLSIVDSVFYERHTPPSDSLQSVVNAIKNGFDSVQSSLRGLIEQETLEPTVGARQQVIEQEVLIPPLDWISKVINPLTPNELYQSIINDNSFPVHHNNGLDVNAVLQSIKENNLTAYSTIINTPNGKEWLGKQLRNDGSGG